MSSPPPRRRWRCSAPLWKTVRSWTPSPAGRRRSCGVTTTAPCPGGGICGLSGAVRQVRRRMAWIIRGHPAPVLRLHHGCHGHRSGPLHRGGDGAPLHHQLLRDDVRITTNYFADLVASSLYSVVHEGGHALYELHVGRELSRTCLGGGVSHGHSRKPVPVL